MKRLYLLVLVALMAFAIPLGVSARTRPQVYLVHLEQLNNSGVMGGALLLRRGDQLTVILVAHGLEANMVHPQHIHGFTDTPQDSVCPPPEAAGTDGILTLAEGLPYYGPVVVPLQNMNGDFPTANPGGVVVFIHTFDLSTLSITDLTQFTIVLHGMTVNNAYDASLPVACGQIIVVGQQPTSS
ncbi:MAG TPA: hypothetical protein VFI42_07375 [Thermomicrobiaceae bacterium]|nr:hypothetical protein [Thermomicrobiaceae bacterium]